MSGHGLYLTEKEYIVFTQPLVKAPLAA